MATCRAQQTAKKCSRSGSWALLVFFGAFLIDARNLAPSRGGKWDIQLPGLNGYEVTRRLKADPVVRKIPIIAITLTR
jgi:hypothetical protein